MSCFFKDCFTFHLFALPFYFLPFPLRYFAPQSHLHIGLPFGTSIPCPQLEQVMIRLGSFSPTLYFFSRSRSMKGRPSCFLFEIISLFTFLLLPFYFLPFPLRYCTSTSRLHIGCYLELYDPCLQAQQVRVCGGFLFVIPACDFVHYFCPCGGLCRCLLCCSPFFLSLRCAESPALNYLYACY